MLAKERPKRAHVAGLMILGLTMILAQAEVSGQETVRASSKAKAAGADGPKLVHLAPGATVKTQAPAGWSYRVIRSIPRLASGELESLPKSAAATAALFRTVIAVKVVQKGSTYELTRVGLGNAVPVGNDEVVVTEEGPDDALETLGFVDRVVLKEAEAELNKGKLAARTSTFALYRAPSTLAVGKKHVAIDLLYALMIDPQTGALTTLTWAVPAGARAAVSKVIELPQGLSFEAPLDVKVTQWLGPVPVAYSFAMASLPPGRAIEVPEDARRIVADACNGADPSALEQTLQSLATSSRAR
ncbi:hypothetical protein [Singulisphaera sp. PoT]|uniref:hypothetical protein n=1 Tax=Singulisphaera sp. PoT TaxID=3411797 RepID=UPI003BF4DC4A